MRARVVLGIAFCVIASQRDTLADGAWNGVPPEYKDVVGGHAGTSAARWNQYKTATCFYYTPYLGGFIDLSVTYGSVSGGSDPFGHTTLWFYGGFISHGTTVAKSGETYYEVSPGSCGTPYTRTDGSKWVQDCPSIFTVLNHELGHAAGLFNHSGSRIQMGNIMASPYYPDGGPGYGWPAQWEIVDVESDDGALERLVGQYGGLCLEKPAGGKSVLGAVPGGFTVHAPWPNPFNSTTNITVSLPEDAYVQVRIYTSLGQKIRTLEIGERPAGNYKYQWNGRDERGSDVASGVYLVRMELPERGFAATQRMSLVR